MHSIHAHVQHPYHCTPVGVAAPLVAIDVLQDPPWVAQAGVKCHYVVGKGTQQDIIRHAYCGRRGWWPMGWPGQTRALCSYTAHTYHNAMLDAFLAFAQALSLLREMNACNCAPHDAVECSITQRTLRLYQ